MQVVSCPKLSNIRKSITLSQGSPASPFSDYPAKKSSIRTKKGTQHWYIDTDRGKPEYSVPTSVCPLQFSHGLARDGTRATRLEVRDLQTAWIMERFFKGYY